MKRGTFFSIVAVAEGAYPQGGEQQFRQSGDQVYVPRLGGIGQRVAEYVSEQCQIESRVTVLGHLQRGGSPTPFDRWLATDFGAAAVREANGGHFGKMVALRGGTVGSVTLEEALAVPKRVPVGSDLVLTARGMGISFGDESP